MYLIYSQPFCSETFRKNPILTLLIDVVFCLSLWVKDLGVIFESKLAPSDEDENFCLRIKLLSVVKLSLCWIKPKFLLLMFGSFRKVWFKFMSRICFEFNCLVVHTICKLSTISVVAETMSESFLKCPLTVVSECLLSTVLWLLKGMLLEFSVNKICLEDVVKITFVKWSKFLLVTVEVECVFLLFEVLVIGV